MEAELAEVRAFLSQTAPLDGLPEAALNSLPARFEIRYFRRNMPILELESPNETLYLVRKGAVELRDRDGELIDRLSEGQWFGYPSLLTGQRAQAEVRALEDTLVYTLSDTHFQALRNRFESVDRFFSQAHADRIRTALKELQHPEGLSLMTTRLHELIRREPVEVSPELSIREAARRMQENRVSSVLVTANGELEGIFTDRDLRNRVVAANISPDSAVAKVMTSELVTADANDLVFELLLAMTTHGIHHMPVLAEGKLIGLLTTSDLIRLQSASPLYVVADIRKQTELESLARVSHRRFEVLRQLVRADATAYDIGKVLSAIGDAVNRRLLELAEGRLGAPPIPYTWLVFGSQARLEHNVYSDQDNGLLLAESPDEEAQSYFAELARYVSVGLDRCGYRFCPGKVMATNSTWRQPLATWRRYFETWIGEPEPEALLKASVFFDMRALYGDKELFGRLQGEVLNRTSQEQIFSRYLLNNALEHRPPLGFFRQMVLERSGEHAQTLNLKQRGAVPIIDLARAYSLEAGLEEVNTRDRLAALAAHGLLSKEGAANLSEALEWISYLRLRHQARKLEGGESPDNYVSPRELSDFERRHLRDAFSIVTNMQAAAAQSRQLRSLG